MKIDFDILHNTISDLRYDNIDDVKKVISCDNDAIEYLEAVIQVLYYQQVAASKWQEKVDEFKGRGYQLGRG